MELKRLAAALGFSSSEKPEPDPMTERLMGMYREWWR
jgi:hypothetical protein